MSKLELFVRNTDLSANETWSSGVHRILPFKQLVVNVRNPTHNSLLHFDQGTSVTALNDPNVRYRQTRETHNTMHDHYEFPIHMEYGKLVFEEVTGVDTSGLSIYGYANENVLPGHQALKRTVYDNEHVTSSDFATPLDVEYFKDFDIFGSVNAAVTIQPYISMDASLYYPHSTEIDVTGAGDFHTPFSTTARWLSFTTSGSDVSMTLLVTGQD